MFLFKKTKNLVKRIGMNMAVYGFVGVSIIFVGVSIIFVLLPFLPENIVNYVYALSVICSFVFIIGSIISIVCFFIELFIGEKTSAKTNNQIENKQVCSLCGDGSSNNNIVENNDKVIPVLPSVTYEKKIVDDKTVFTIYKDELVYTYTQLERREGGRGYNYIIKALINDNTHYFYFSEIPQFNATLGWNVMTIDKNVYDGICKKEVTDKIKIIHFLGKTPTFVNDEYMPHIIVELMNYIPLNSKLDDTIDIMVKFLRDKNYDIEFTGEEMTIVEHSDDPWNHFNKFFAKSDGMYNFVEKTMGLYVPIKRLTCSNFDVACFVVLAYFFVENISSQEDDGARLIINEIKKHIDDILKNISDYEMGQVFVDRILDVIK